MAQSSRGRGRERRGAHASVAGAPAEETLEDLVSQFADRHAFVRELIQNSLDAGAAHIELCFRWADDTLCIDVVDDGEGMDRATIEGYLLTLFRSTKEDDLTKIGKFGIGFVSLFAMEPERVEVVTARDLVAHRVRFAADRSWVLEELDELLEGTTVTLQLRCGREEARRVAERVLAGAHTWCRFARATIVHRAEGLGPWEPGEVHGVREVDAPVSVTVEEDGLHAVLGPSGEARPAVTFVSGGLTLWEGSLDVVPGVTFLVEGRHLEHTLTRDNVRRDRHFERVVRRLHQAATQRLAPAVDEALVAATAAGDAARLAEVLAACRPDAAFALRTDTRWVPAIPEPVTLGTADRRLAEPLLSWFAERQPMWCRAVDDALARRLADEGLVVRDAPDGVVAAWLAERTGAEPVDPARWCWVQPVQGAPWQEALRREAARYVGRALAFAAVHGAGEDRLAMAAPHDDVLLAPEAEKPVDTVVIRIDHPLIEALRPLPVGVAGPLLAHGVQVAVDGPAPVGWATVQGAVDAWTTREGR